MATGLFMSFFKEWESGNNFSSSCSTGPAHLADVVSEDWLILRASDLPLEPGLRFPVVGNLQSCSTVANLRQIRHGVSHCDGSVDSTITSVARQKIQCKCIAMLCVFFFNTINGAAKITV